jgi:hypothetical protein
VVLLYKSRLSQPLSLLPVFESQAKWFLLSLNHLIRTFCNLDASILEKVVLQGHPPLYRLLQIHTLRRATTKPEETSPLLLFRHPSQLEHLLLLKVRPIPPLQDSLHGRVALAKMQALIYLKLLDLLKHKLPPNPGLLLDQLHQALLHDRLPLQLVKRFHSFAQQTYTGEWKKNGRGSDSR